MAKHLHVTTKCPHCNYRTRNQEELGPKIQLGQTIFCCPRCDKPMIDPFYTEYEFMSENERRKFTTKRLASSGIANGISLILLAIFLIAGGIAIAETVAIILTSILGVAALWMATSEFIDVFRAKKLNVGEQAIYESLLRTSNVDYVNLLKQYDQKHEFQPISNRAEMINDLKQYSTEDIHEANEKEFLKIVEITKNNNIDIQQMEASYTYARADIYTYMTGRKQRKDVEAKNKNSEEHNNTNNKPSLSTKNKVSKNNNSIKQNLLDLKELYDEELISEDEYNEKRKQILEKF